MEKPILIAGRMTLDKGFWTICSGDSELGPSEHVFIDLCFLTMDTM